MRIYALHIKELFATDVEKWSRDIVSIRIYEKIKRLKFMDDKKRTLAGELLARYALVLEKQIPKTEIIFDVYENGKPYCTSFPKMHFNISHSGSWVVCAVSDRPIGIDIEKVGLADMQIARRFFTKYEYQYLQRQENQAEVFYKLWTLKESYIKYTGQGLTVPLNSFEFEFCDGSILLKDREDLYFISGKVFENYYLSACGEEQDKIMNLKTITLKEIEKHV